MKNTILIVIAGLILIAVANHAQAGEVQDHSSRQALISQSTSRVVVAVPMRVSTGHSTRNSLLTSAEHIPAATAQLSPVTYYNTKVMTHLEHVMEMEVASLK